MHGGWGGVSEVLNIPLDKESASLPYQLYCEADSHLDFLPHFPPHGPYPSSHSSSSCVALRALPRPTQGVWLLWRGHRESGRRREGQAAVKTTVGPTHGGEATAGKHHLWGERNNFISPSNQDTLTSPLYSTKSTHPTMRACRQEGEGRGHC